MQTVIEFIILLIIGIIIGVGIDMDYNYRHPIVKTVVNTVYQQPTPEQLAAWWFGSTDKTMLKEKICGNKFSSK